VGALPPLATPLGIAAATVLAAAVLFVLLQERGLPSWIAIVGGLGALYAESRWLPGLRERSALREARREARRLAKSVRSALAKQRSWLGADVQQRVDAALATVDKALPGTDLAGLEFATRKLEEAADAHLKLKSARREYVEQIGGAVLVALLLRAFAWEAFRIPSSSMVPTLLVGDHLFVNKWVYGIRIPFTLHKLWTKAPARGDIVVFNRPGDEGGDDIIKRVVGLPGDRIEVRNRRVSVNGEPLQVRPDGELVLDERGDPASGDVPDARRFRAFEEDAGGHTHLALELEGAPQSEGFGNEGVWFVQPDHVFVMGDNRDNSADSRFGRERAGFGQVPLGHVKGRADVIWLSLRGWGWRPGRMFSGIR